MKYEFEWTEAMSVNNDIIDSQHKKLLNQANAVLKSFVDGDSEEIIKSSLEFFDKYIEEHLKFEDNYMKVNNYPKVEEHEEMHKKFIDKYNDFKERVKNGAPKEAIIIEIEEYIGNWWIEHIGKADKDYAEYIKNKQ